MKKIIFIAVLLAFSALCLAGVTETAKSNPPGALEKEGDKLFAQRNAVTDTAADLAIVQKAMEDFKKAFEADKANEKLFYKYGKAYDFMHRYLTGTVDDKKAAYEAFSREYEPLGATMGNTKEYNYILGVMWARRGDLTGNVLEAAKEGVADTIKKYAENLYNMDKTFDDYAAGLILGRLHFKSPNIIFILGWPDKNKSIEYLREVVAGQPGNTEAKYFLADTLWDQDKKEEAKKLFLEVSSAKPRKDYWYFDNLSISKCKDRMKELEITEAAPAAK